MPTAAIGSSSNVAAATAAANLRLEDLFQVLLTELTHQDPFKPLDNKDFISQIAQFTTLESTQQLNDSIGQLLALQALNQSVGLIGRTVSATADSGTVRGKVTAITLSDGAPRLTITDSAGNVVANVAIGQLQLVQPSRQP